MITPAFAITATERVLPKLALDFTTASLDSRITFTRTTGASNPATYIDSSGVITAATNNQPRFDYDPVTLVCKGLLIEESRSNIIIYSEDFSVANWSKTRASVTANATTAPDNAVTADKLVEDTTASNNHGIGQFVNAPAANSTVTATIYIKAAGRNFAQIRLMDNAANVNGGQNQYNIAVNLSDGSVGTTYSAGSPINPSYTVTNAGNGWWRCSLTLTKKGDAVRTDLTIYPWTSNNAVSNPAYTGDGTSGLYIWGAQLEAGAFATSYIPTTTAALTRNADVATMTGTNFSDWWQAGKGGAQVQAIPSTVSGIRPLVQYDDGTANEIIALRGNTTNPELYVVDGGTPQAQLDAGTIAANTAYSLTGWWQTNDCKARKDSGAVVTDDTATIPTVTQARLGSDGTNYLNGHLASVNYYDSFFGQSIYTRRKNKVIFNLM